jgi:hypothetical protein
MNPKPKPTLARLARALLAALLAAGAGRAAIGPGISVGVARAEEPWKAEFADVCSKTQDAMTLSTAELEALLARAEKIGAAIEKLDDVQRKAYERRLKACVDLYRFVLDSKKAAGSTDAAPSPASATEPTR